MLKKNGGAKEFAIYDANTGKAVAEYENEIEIDTSNWTWSMSGGE